MNQIMNTNKCMNTCLAKKTPKDYRLKPSKSPVESPSCRHRRKNLSFLFLFYFSLIPTPIWRVLCVISISFPFRDMSCVCVYGNMCTCVRVSTSLESPPIMGNLRCDWAPMSNRFYLV